MTIEASSAIENLERIVGEGVTKTISKFEQRTLGTDSETAENLLSSLSVDQDAWSSALKIKKVSAQIDVLVHAIGILRSLPHILEKGETVEYVSLGAGNTGRKFDLETNFRVAEYKFIAWKGGAESIRQNGVFKDFFNLANEDTDKDKFLYLTGTDQALKFLQGGRAMKSVLSKDAKTERVFAEKFGERYTKVSDYFRDHERSVKIVDISSWLN